MARDVAHAGVSAAPGIAVWLATLAGVTLQDWVYLATLGFLLLQGAFLIWRWVRMAHERDPPTRTPFDE